jgi:rRNA-processing arch domain
MATATELHDIPPNRSASFFSQALNVLARRLEGLRTMREAVSRLAKKFGGQPPLLDAQRDMKVKSSSYKKLKMQLDSNTGLLEKSPLYKKCAASSLSYHGGVPRAVYLVLCGVRLELGWAGKRTQHHDLLERCLEDTEVSNVTTRRTEVYTLGHKVAHAA